MEEALLIKEQMLLWTMMEVGKRYKHLYARMAIPPMAPPAPT